MQNCAKRFKSRHLQNSFVLLIPNYLIFDDFKLKVEIPDLQS